eukprot:NODE_19096_length_860_cov_4.500682.p4 GENE.NODE_19096_length_860_cov_4.500682~~NODE_19096_length_860_cov_4.500682.p4  ORF type:complete len:86 (+),score=25.45 NODE_19096_length_860_cov_4.500682:327-584(+)
MVSTTSATGTPAAAPDGSSGKPAVHLAIKLMPPLAPATVSARAPGPPPLTDAAAPSVERHARAAPPKPGLLRFLCGCGYKLGAVD